jgi:hypothetical protein
MKSKKTDDVARLDVLAGYILVFLLGLVSSTLKTVR